MKERPILFSGAMVRAILDGRKTQTRRAVKPQAAYPASYDSVRYRINGCAAEFYLPGATEPAIRWLCAYGKPGDRLWVRETFTPDGVNAKAAADLGRQSVHYRADGEAPDYLKVRWRPAIHMPRWASRITLEVERVRVERLQEISESDAIAEGVLPLTGQFLGSFAVPGTRAASGTTAVECFSRLWDSINQKKGFGWAANPWVWVIEFKPALKPEEAHGGCNSEKGSRRDYPLAMRLRPEGGKANG